MVLMQLSKQPLLTAILSLAAALPLKQEDTQATEPLNARPLRQVAENLAQKPRSSKPPDQTLFGKSYGGRGSETLKPLGKDGFPIPKSAMIPALTSPFIKRTSEFPSGPIRPRGSSSNWPRPTHSYQYPYEIREHNHYLHPRFIIPPRPRSAINRFRNRQPYAPY